MSAVAISTSASKKTSGTDEVITSTTSNKKRSSSVSCIEYDGAEEIFRNPDKMGPLFLRRKMTKKKLTAVISQRKLFLFKASNSIHGFAKLFMPIVALFVSSRKRRWFCVTLST